MESNPILFEKIDAESVIDVAAAQIEQLIISGVLQSNRQLPSEREMSEQMGVSRPTIREAIRQLEERGLLTVKHGGGTFVAPLTGTALSPAMIELFARHREAFIDYLEFRREVEGFAAYVAAQRATDTDREIIEGIMASMTSAHDAGDRERELEFDVKLHAAIVDATHNAMLIQVMASIYELMRQVIRQGRLIQQERGISLDRLLDQHQKIADGILARDPDAAAKAAEDHINYVESNFRERDKDSKRSAIARKRRFLLDRGTLGNSTQRRRA